MYRNDPEKWKNADYDAYLTKVREIPEVADPAKIFIDDYNSKINLITDCYKKEIKTFNALKLGERKDILYNDLDLASFI